MILRLSQAILPIALLWTTKVILDTCVQHVRSGNTSYIELLPFFCLEIGLVVLADVLRRGATLCDSLLGDQLECNITMRLMSHAAHIDLTTFDDPIFYDKLERARRHSAGRIGMIAAVFNRAQDFLTLLSLSGAVVLFSPVLFILLLFTVLPSFLGETHFSTLDYSLLYRWTPQRRILDYLCHLATSSSSAKEVKLFNLGDYLTTRYEKIARSFYRANEALAVRHAVLGSALNVIATGGYYGAYGAAILATLRGQLTIGSLTFLAAAFTRSRSAFQNLFSGLTYISEQGLILNDLFECLAADGPPKVESRCSIPPSRHMTTGFEFRSVTFRYPGCSRCVLDRVSFRIEPYEKIALVGPNGAGKTTLLKLLCRLYDPLDGEILLDGVDIRDYEISEFRAQFSVLFQDYVRYDMLLRENISLGATERVARTDELHKAASEGLAEGLLARLPHGMETMLGRRFEGGVGLSGGEWQKVALSRACFRNARIFLLDEPTSSVDAETEAAFSRHMEELLEERMALIVSHRFSTVRMADRILVLSDGRIADAGSHRELVSRPGLYADLFEAQAAAYR
jgi:ATP-binding cassette subfamily B protein